MYIVLNTILIGAHSIWSSPEHSLQHMRTLWLVSSHSRIEIVIVTVIAIIVHINNMAMVWNKHCPQHFWSVTVSNHDLNVDGRNTSGKEHCPQHMRTLLVEVTHQDKAGMGSKFSQRRSNHIRQQQTNNSLRHNVGVIPLKVINTRQPFCQGLRAAGVGDG